MMDESSRESCKAEEQSSSKNQKSNDNSKPTSSIHQPAVGQPLKAKVTAVPPLRQPHPPNSLQARPNLRRQVVVTTGNVEHHPRLSGQPIEIASVLPGGTTIVPVPPKRPAHLPSRYGHVLAKSTGNTSSGKPNRYAWAQMQHWQHTPSSNLPGDTAGDVHGQHHGFHHFSSAASRVLVVNPMQMVNLSEHTKSRLIKFIEALKRFSEQWFSHVLLLLFLAVYACLGAYVFISFEAPTEQWEKQLIIDTRQHIVNESWGEAQTRSRDDFVNLFQAKFEDYERLLNRACASGMTSTSLENQWTFWGALFYSMTVFTTIGYGHLTPITFAGRVATMVYAIFGIPILLMVLADLGKLLTRIIKFAFKKFRYLFNKILRRKKSLRTRKMISDNTSQYIGVVRGAFERGVAHIQPYARFPHAFRTRAGQAAEQEDEHEKIEESRGEHRDSKHKPLHETQSQSNSTTDTNIQQQHEASGQSTKTQDISTGVIVTPVKQTKPVSPQVGEKKSIADAMHHNGHHQHHQYGRSQSPGLQSKRKTSSGTSPAGSKKAQPSKASISRSSSSSNMATNTGDNKGSTSKITQKATKTPSKLSHAKEQTSQEQQQENSSANIKSGSVNESELNSGVEMADIEANYEDEDEHENEFDIPVSFALFLLVTYMMFGAVIFSIWEGWNFFDALYFVFISMSTIGFGDLVPQHPKRMIGTFIYLLFGLALTSMCINVVQEKIHATFLRAKMQIGEKMGLDLEQIMADDYYDGSIGMDGDEEGDESQSMAASQTKSSSWAHINSPECEPFCADWPKTVGQPTESGEGVKLSKSKDSFIRSKKRSVTGLPGHGNQLAGGSFRRKSNKNKISRQMTPNSTTLPQSPPIVAETLQQTFDSPASVMPEIAIHKIEQFNPTTDQPSINQPVTPLAERRAFCEPLTSQAIRIEHNDQMRPKLMATRSQPSPQMVKSLSSEANRQIYKQESNQSNVKNNGRRSAGSSRRSSVSHELNELDDLIVALSKSPSDRFGPLLGIPSSARSSRSNSPSSSLQARRGTSMTNRPVSRASTAGESHSPRQKKRSLASMSGQVAAKQVATLNLNESQVALDELEAVKYSVV